MGRKLPGLFLDAGLTSVEVTSYAAVATAYDEEVLKLRDKADRTAAAGRSRAPTPPGGWRAWSRRTAPAVSSAPSSSSPCADGRREPADDDRPGAGRPVGRRERPGEAIHGCRRRNRPSGAALRDARAVLRSALRAARDPALVRGSSGLVASGRALVGGRHLDVGAGTCRYSRYWARAGFRSVCLDVLHQMLARARLGGTGGRLARVCGTLDCLRPDAGLRPGHGHRRRRGVRGRAGGGPGPVPRPARAADPAGRPVPLRLHHAGRPAPVHLPELARAVDGGRITADSRGRFDEAARVLSVDLTLETPDHVAHERHVMRLYTVDEIEAAAPAPGLRRHRGHRSLRRPRRVLPGRPAVLRRPGPAAVRAGER